MLTEEEPATFFYIKEGMIYLQDYHCQITKVFESRQPNLLSFAFPKNSPYLGFIDYHLLKLMEQGTMSLLKKKYLDVDFDCRDDDQDVSLSFVKLVSLFAILGTGVVSSVILFACEIFFKDHYKDHTSSKSSKPDLEMTGGSEADLIEPPYDDRLKKFMFKWGVSNRSAFLLDFEQLLKLKHAERGGGGSVSLLNGYSSVNSRHGSAATTVTTTNMGTGISRSPMPLRMSQRFVYRHNGISKSYYLMWIQRTFIP